MNLSKSVFVALSTMLLLCGCATSRSVVQVGTAPAYQVSNPDQGTAIRLVTTDERKFELAPATPDIPSLKDGEINNPAITARAIGRKRNTYGRALGDVLLPEGQNVAQIVGEAIANGFRGAGYRVVTEGDPDFATATPVNAKIVQFWLWIDPGFWAITVENRTELTISSVLPGFEKDFTALLTQKAPMGAVFESDWQKEATRSLNDVTQDLTNRLPKPAAMSASN